MPDLDQIKQGKQGVRERRRPARDGQSGNPGRHPVATAGYATSYAQMVTDLAPCEFDSRHGVF
jgi:hypothetical protein